MKELFRGLAAILLATLAVSASALTVSMAEQARSEGWQQFSKAMIEDGLMDAGADRFSAVAITNAIYYNALTPAQQAAVTRAQLHERVLQENNLGTDVLVADWPRIAERLKVPDIQVPVAQADPPATMSAPAATVTAPAPATPETKPAITAENVAARLKELAAEVSTKDSVTQQLIKDLQTQVRQAATKNDLAAVTSSIKPTVEGLMKRFNDRLTTVEGRLNDPYTGLAVLDKKTTDAAALALAASTNASDAKVDASAAKQLAAEAKTTADEAKTMAAKSKDSAASVSSLWDWVYGMAAAMVLLTFGVIVALWRRAPGVVKPTARVAPHASPLRAVGDKDGPTFMEPGLDFPKAA